MAGGTPTVLSSPSAIAVGSMTGFVTPAVQPTRYSISGITKDSLGAVLPNCSLSVFQTGGDIELAQVTSDANGVYSITVTGAVGATFYIVAYKAGSPDVAGTTVNTLLAINS